MGRIGTLLVVAWRIDGCIHTPVVNWNTASTFRVGSTLAASESVNNVLSAGSGYLLAPFSFFLCAKWVKRQLDLVLCSGKGSK